MKQVIVLAHCHFPLQVSFNYRSEGAYLLPPPPQAVFGFQVKGWWSALEHSFSYRIIYHSGFHKQQFMLICF